MVFFGGKALLLSRSSLLQLKTILDLFRNPLVILGLAITVRFIELVE